MKKTYVKPCKGRTVINPATRKAIPDRGAWVPRNGYWARRLQAGEVVEAAPPKGGGTAKQRGGES